MAIGPFLAMTAAEIRNHSHFPRKIAWMACHFSPYGSGLSNLPRMLPEESLLILDDITPIHGHDPQIIARQLLFCLDELRPSGILLDFQRPGYPEAAALVKYLSDVLPCPVAVSEYYADSVQIPVFLPPVPPSVPLLEYLKPWQNREVWLDISTWGETLTLSEDGCTDTSLPPWDTPEEGFPETSLHFHYRSSVKETSAKFTLWRTEADMKIFLEEAEDLGVSKAVGLYQELKGLSSLT